MFHVPTNNTNLPLLAPELKIDSTSNRIAVPISPVLNTAINSYVTAGIQETGDQQLDQLLQSLNLTTLYYFLDTNQHIVFIIVRNIHYQIVAIVPDVGRQLYIASIVSNYILKPMQVSATSSTNLLSVDDPDAFNLSLIVDGLLKFNPTLHQLTLYPTNMSMTQGALSLRTWQLDMDQIEIIWPVVYYSTLLKAPQDTHKNILIAYYRLNRFESKYLNEKIGQHLTNLENLIQQIPYYRQQVDCVINALQRSIYMSYIIKASYNTQYYKDNTTLIKYIKQHVSSPDQLDINYISQYIEKALIVSVDETNNNVIRVNKILIDRHDKLLKLQTLLRDLNSQLSNTSLHFLSDLMNKINQTVGSCQELYRPV